MSHTAATFTLCRASAGTGKTYMLTHRYVDLLLAGESYRTILAITFTNKATAEMKERILTLLYNQGMQGNEQAMRLFHTILADFNNLKVMTIDSFLQGLMRGLALKIDKAAGYSVDLDLEHALITAVDQLMSTHIDEQPQLRQTIERHLRLQLEAENGWDFRAETIHLAYELFSESVQKAEADGKAVFDPVAIQTFIDELGTRLRNATDQTEKNTIERTLQHLNDMLLLGYIRYRIDINQSENNSILLSNTAAILKRELASGDADFILEKAGIRYRHILIDEFQDTSDLQWFTIFTLVRELLAGGNTTLIVGDIKQSIYRWRNGNWHIMANLDRDASIVPYLNTEYLHRNYRSARQIVEFNLDTFRRIAAPYDFYAEGYDGTNLSNYYVPDKHEGGFVSLRFYPIASRGKEPELKSEPQRQAMLVDMFRQIEYLLEQPGVTPQDILILIRRNDSADMLNRVYDSLIASELENFPMLRLHKPVSGDSFRLESSLAVQRVIAALEYIATRDATSRYLIALYQPDAPLDELDALAPDMPLNLLVEEVIRICLCPSGKYDGDDIAYLNAFRDKTLDYVIRYGSDLKQFLQLWQDRMHRASIPTVSAGEMRIMTIHSAKGLEARFTFLPFCSWPMEESGKHGAFLWAKPAVSTAHTLPLVPLTDHRDLKQAGYADVYDAEHRDQRIDNTNLLYVALTRAAEHLYIYCDIAYSAALVDTKKPRPITECKDVAEALLKAYNLGAALKDLVADFPNSACRFLEQTFGSIGEFSASQLTPNAEPFSFDAATPIHAAFYSTNKPIEFQQSMEAIQFASHDADNARDLGNLCHDILAHIRTTDDIEQVLQTYLAQADISSNAMLEEIRAMIDTMLSHRAIADWFSGQWQVMCERTIMLDPATATHLNSSTDCLRPDRIMIKGNHAVVLDYKFGEHESDAHMRQVRRYMHLITMLGFSKVEGYLYYAQLNLLKSVTL